MPNALPPPPATSDEARASSVPLCVDLDGTLIYTDMLWETMAVLLRRNFLSIFQVAFWFLHGRAYLKRQVAQRTTVDPATLPYNQDLLTFIRAEKTKGRQLLLVSASEHALVAQVAAHVGLFDEVMASDGRTNLRGAQKTAALVARFGQKGYDYAGNSHVDWPVWASARRAIVVNARPALVHRAQQHFDVAAVYPRPPKRV